MTTCTFLASSKEIQLPDELWYIMICNPQPITINVSRLTYKKAYGEFIL